MPRQARLDAPGTLHHVMIRGIEGIKIFQDANDRQNFLFRLGTLVQKTGTQVCAWALMDNHAHLLVLSGREGISSFMRKLLTGYALSYNRRHQRTGHLFQNRYESIVCEERPYLLELVRYIHLNPIRASVVTTMKELDTYRWSGHSVIMGTQENGWQAVEYVVTHFGKEKRRALQKYRTFVAEGRNQGTRPELVGAGLIRSLGGWSRVLSLRGSGEQETRDSRILGSGDFVERILRQAEDRVKRQIKARSKEEILDEVIGRMCTEEKIREEELRAGGKRRPVTKVRARIAYYLSKEKGIPMAEIARRLGVGTSAIGMIIRKKDDKGE